MTTDDHDDDGQQAEPDMNAYIRDELARRRGGTAARFAAHLADGFDPEPEPDPTSRSPDGRSGTLHASRLFQHVPEPPTAA